MNVMDWLLDSDPAIRWHVLRDLTHAPPDEVAAERRRVECEGWGARILALAGDDALWDGGALFPAGYSGDEPGQPWTTTMHSLQTLQIFGLDSGCEAARRAIGLVADNARWENAGQRYFDGEVEPCINGRTIETGAYFGVDAGCSTAPTPAESTSPLRVAWGSRAAGTPCERCESSPGGTAAGIRAWVERKRVAAQESAVARGRTTAT